MEEEDEEDHEEEGDNRGEHQFCVVGEGCTDDPAEGVVVEGVIIVWIRFI